MRYADAGLPYGLIEMLLVFGVVLAFAVWELISVRRSIRSDETARRELGDKEPPSKSPPPS